MNKLSTFLNNYRREKESRGLWRRMRNLDGAQGREIVVDGQRVLNFCSNDYLGLAGDARLAAAATECMKREGFGSGASRLVCGNMTAHRRLEEKLAAFKGTESALVFSSGYMANAGIIAALCGRGDAVLSDRLNHASIVDGIVLSRAVLKRYPHNDMKALEDLLRTADGFRQRLIVTDSVFSMDGDIAPLQVIADVARRYDAMVMVDEAHGFGVLGDKGRGAVEMCGVEELVDVQMGTLSKAAGSFGAYVCGSRELIDYLVNAARSFVYTTAMPPSVAAASLRAIEIIEEEPERRVRVMTLARRLREELKRMGLDTLESQTPIVPVVVGESQRAVEWSKGLFERGIFVQPIRPPTVPVHTARLRLTVTAAHTDEDLERCCEVFKLLSS